ncbi:MAG TPA: hypothetical protein VHJ18_01830 [Streptosporangiaceae bacterium]|jgi:hypothetical protein|nr:hypothetical protein [Streptosporangiaceae bacterium]
MSHADVGLVAVTIDDREWRGMAMFTVSCFVILAGLPLATNASTWMRHGEPAAVVMYPAAVAIALARGCARAWRMQVRIDEHSVLVCKFFRTHQMGWPEMGRFEDGSRWIAGICFESGSTPAIGLSTPWHASFNVGSRAYAIADYRRRHGCSQDA